jgi:hypothetical protein
MMGIIKLWLNQDNTGTFVEAGPAFETGTVNIGLLDADKDGDLDLITSHLTNGNKLWRNNGSATFTSVGQLFGTTRILSMACGRLDNDNDDDIVMGVFEYTGGNPIYFNQTNAACAGLPGDANHDGRVNVGDAVYMINHVFKGSPAPACEILADANSDCRLNVGDAVFLINYVFKTGTAPQCGCLGS